MTSAGIVLCGGHSRRMGRAKAWLPFAGELLLPRIVRLLGEAATPVVVVAAPGQDLPPLPRNVLVVRDEVEDRGPLQGLAAGLGALRRPDVLSGAASCDAVFLSSCDVPFLNPAVVRRLGELIGDHAICVPRVGERYHPLAALYRLDILDSVRRLLAEDRLRLTTLLEVLPTRVVAAEELVDLDPTLRSFQNVNTPEDYAAALRSLT